MEDLVHTHQFEFREDHFDVEQVNGVSRKIMQDLGVGR